MTANLIDVEIHEIPRLRHDLPPELDGWRLCQVELYAKGETPLWTGSLPLPPGAYPETLAQLILGQQVHGLLWRATPR